MKVNLSEALLTEFDHESQNTLKLFNDVSNDVLQYKPNDFNWTIAELCSHISESYYWWVDTLEKDHFEMSEYQYDKGDISNIESIIKKCEQNIAQTRAILENYPEEKWFDIWRMTMNGVDLFPPAKRIGVVRNFLINHMIHHRGELVAYLRANHQRVPGLYGPSYEEMNPTQPDV